MGRKRRTISVTAVQSATPGAILNGDNSESGVRTLVQSTMFGKTEIDVEELAKNLKSFLDKIRDVLSAIPVAVGAFKVDTMTVDVEISAEGGISLLGTGGKIGGKGGLSLTFKR